MKAFFDTSVLVAALLVEQEDHAASLDAFLRYEKEQACCGAHNLAEVYSTVTGKYRTTPDEVMPLIDEIRARLTIITLTAEEYYHVIELSAEIGLAGGGIYDALLGHCALKSGAETIYTWNVKDFKRLGPGIAARVATP